MLHVSRKLSVAPWRVGTTVDAPDDLLSWVDIQIVTLATAHGLLVACGQASWAVAAAAAAKPHQPASLWLRASVRERRRYLGFVECALRVSVTSALVAATTLIQG